ncbi:MAG: hypothetical protein JW991_05500 [Candidatus Pacebacteria bacterium]|nr:hypothetical protein [Candidatus Paceibacterota bacterium]
MKKNWSNFYLVGFSAVVMISLLAASFIFWDDYFQKSLSAKKTAIQSALSKTFSHKEAGLESEVDLSLTTQDESLVPGQEVEVQAIIETGGRETWGGDLCLVYEPDQIEILEVRAGDFFPEPLLLENLIDKKEGEVRLSVGSLKVGKGRGTLGIISFRVKEGADLAKLSFLESTQVALKGKLEPASVTFHDLALPVEEE